MRLLKGKNVPGIRRRCQEYDDASSQVIAKTRLKRSPCSEKTLCDTCAESIIYGRSVSREQSMSLTCRLITYNMRAIREIGSLEATFGERRAIRVLDTFCEEEKPVRILHERVNDDPGSKKTALVDKSPARELDFSRPITPPPPPPPELTRERGILSAIKSPRVRCGAGGTVLSLPDHQADLVPNYKSH
ncbi:hypothetical protein ALC57_07144 [Trachymyrmex cornetzi]|uniref:Uncharacterized protein n=1 Tax=Trachymyrmex cornetzi TaxID=471704 RepID=A0A195E4X4_9HYME|nr:hypothetical protein ALC57_07144 [Trachymyrmex cornetzi]